jgi:aryl-alcohol dehydrogenase-like predicted oxidoreductase
MAADRPTSALLQRAFESGIGYVDTAAAYGGAERAVGEIADLIAERGVRVCTKISAEEAGADGATARVAVERSAARLRAPRVDTVLLHNATASTFASPSVGRALQALVDDGLVGRVGGSTYGAEAARAARASAWCGAVQVEFSILNQSVMRSLAGWAGPRQEIIARSVLCKGLLTGRRAVGGEFAQPVLATIDDLAACARAWGFELPELAIRFALDTPGLDVVLVGIASTDELDVALAAAARAPLSAEQYRDLAAFDRSAFDCVHPERWEITEGGGRR